MKLLFWRKSTPAKPVKKMSEIETALIEDLERTPAAWVVREVRDGVVRADRGPTVIVSEAINEFFRAQAFYANTGPARMSDGFAERWHEIVLGRLTAEKHLQEQKACDYVVEGLTKQFLE